MSNQTIAPAFAVLPVRIRCVTPRYCAHTDALLGVESYDSDESYSDPNRALDIVWDRNDFESDFGSESDYYVIDRAGQRVEAPVHTVVRPHALSCHLCLDPNEICF